MIAKSYFVYLLSSKSRTLYVGVTNDLRRRLDEHRSGRGSAFAQRYGVSRLVYCEAYSDVRDALRREKQLKGWRRSRKIALIEAANPKWLDLSIGDLPEP